MIAVSKGFRTGTMQPILGYLSAGVGCCYLGK